MKIRKSKVTSISGFSISCQINGFIHEKNHIFATESTMLLHGQTFLPQFVLIS